MIIKLTTKNCQISTTSYKIIEKNLLKIQRWIENLEKDLPIFNLILRKNIDKYHPKSLRTTKEYTDIKPALAFYEGAINLTLPKQVLHINFKGQTINECINLGFEILFKKLTQYKDRHFSSESRYPNHTTIRGEVS